jgi:hypothetical protein
VLARCRQQLARCLSVTRAVSVNHYETQSATGHSVDATDVSHQLARRWLRAPQPRLPCMRARHFHHKEGTMLSTQKERIESYRRVHDFLAVHPPPESPGYVAQKKALDEVVASLHDHSSDQVAGRRLRSADGTRQTGLCKVLREEHLSPIAQIARASLRDVPKEIAQALKMPKTGLGPLKLVAEATGMRKAAARYEARFINAGRPADFLQQLDAVAEEISRTALGKARNLGVQVGAGAGIALEIRRGREAIENIDTIVRAAFKGNKTVLAAWRTAKRVRVVASGAGAGASDEVTPDIPALTPIVATQG